MCNKSTHDTARLVLINAELYAEEKNKEYSRLRISKNTIRELSGRSLLRDVFLDDLEDEFDKLGWKFFVYTDTEFGLIRLDKIKVWVKVGPSRIRSLIREYEKGDKDVIGREYRRIFGEDDDELSSGEDE